LTNKFSWVLDTSFEERSWVVINRIGLVTGENASSATQVAKIVDDGEGTNNRATFD
jgi:hypothetical protein